MNNELFLNGLRDNDDAVIQKIFIDFKGPVIRLLMRKSATLVEAEDIFMDALEAIYRKVRKKPFDLEHCTFQTYLTAIWLNHWYRKCRRKKFSAGVTPEELTVLKSNEDPEQEIFEAERSKLFWDAFHQLGEACRKILQLALIDKQPLMEVGEQLGYTYDYARKKKSQCQRKLIETIKSDDRFEELMP